jgi:hypothetical protein
MRKLVVAIIVLTTLGLAIGVTIFNRPVAEALAGAEGYSYPATPSDRAPPRTAESAHAGDRR